MHQVLLPGVVQGQRESLVGRGLVLGYTLSSEPVVLNGVVERGEQVLAGQDVDVVRFLLGVGEQGSGV